MGWLDLYVSLVRSTGRGERGKEARLGTRRWGGQDTGARVEGADLARAGVLVPPSAGLALSKPLALGSQFLLSTGRKMKEVPGWSSGRNLGELPIYPISLQMREPRAREAAWVKLPGFETKSVERRLMDPITQPSYFSHTHASGVHAHPTSRPGSSRHSEGGETTSNVSPGIRLRLRQGLWKAGWPWPLRGAAPGPPAWAQPSPHVPLSRPWLAPSSKSPLALHSGSFQETTAMTVATDFPDKTCIYPSRSDNLPTLL